MADEQIPTDTEQDLDSDQMASDEQTLTDDADSEAHADTPSPSDDRERYLRLAAEYDNYRKRTVKERLEAGARGQAELLKQLIEPLDDIGRFAHVDPATTDAKTMVDAVVMVEKKLLKPMIAAGLEIISPDGEAFDPARHEAVMTEPAASEEDDHLVARVFQVGYVFNGQLLRPARVVVKQWNG